MELLVIFGMFSLRYIKKGYRCIPTFVNLKSNTMKNIVQMYNCNSYFPNQGLKKVDDLT